MNEKQNQQAEVQRTAAHDVTSSGPSARLYTVKQYPIAQPAFSEGALRNLIFKSTPRKSTKGEIAANGLIECGAIIRVGKKILIDDAKFINWTRRQEGGE